MSLPDEFADAFPGRSAAAAALNSPPPAVGLDDDDASSLYAGEPLDGTAGGSAGLDGGVAVDAALAGLVPTTRGPRMGAAATDLPPLDRPHLPDLGPGTAAGEARELRLLSEVQVELAVELGRVKLPLRDLLALGPGAVLELDRAADAPVDVLVNGCLVAKGEVVVIDGEFGVRVTAVVER